MTVWVPEEDDFLNWRESQVTKFFLAAMKVYEEDKKETWIQLSWGAGACDPLRLHELRGQAFSLEFFREAAYDSLVELLKEPEQE